MNNKLSLIGGLALIAGALTLWSCPKKEPPSPEPVVVAPRVSADAAPKDAGPPPGPICKDANGLWHMPNPEWTPGQWCSPSDPDFDGYRYSVKVAHCRRRVTAAEKDEIAKLYGVPKSDYSKYEFDHFIPLSAGGSDDPKNIWPQPLAEAKEKDKVEDEVYAGLKAGTMTQLEAEAKIRAWRPSTCPISP